MGQRTESAGVCRYTAAMVVVLLVAACRDEPGDVQALPASPPRTTQQASDPPAAAAAPTPSATPTPGPAEQRPLAASAAADAPRAATATPRPAAPVAPKRAAASTPAPVTASAAPAPAPAPSPPVPPPGATTDPRFVVWLQPAGSYRAGEQGSVEVVLSCKGEWHCNEKYPMKFTCDPPASGVSYPQPVVRRDAMSIGPD